MQSLRAGTNAEHRVLRWFLIAFFCIAISIITVTLWRKAHDCKVSCATRELGAGRLELAGGGRFGMHVFCQCSTSIVEPSAHN